MINWIKLLFHCHQWKIIRYGNVHRDNSVVGKYYDLQCIVCGNIKRVYTGKV